ncbi:MAG: PQQ-dependent sugar dehydrogenase, partial [Betaproteobacteria bacterium]
PLQTFEEPIYAFVPSVGLSSIVSIHDFNPQWDGDFLLGSLKAQTLYHIKIYHDHVILAEPLWIGHRIRDITIWQKKIVIKTDDSALIFLELDQKALLTNTKSDDLFFDNALKKCLVCHSFQPTNPTSSAPTLLHIYNRAIGQDNFSRYSSALKNKSGRWSADNLSQFIANPSQFAPGTTMPSLGLSNQEIRDVVKLLEKYQ